MDFISFLLNEASQEAQVKLHSEYYKNAGKKHKKTMGLVPDPDHEPEQIKNTRYNYGIFSIQPPVNFFSKTTKQRLASYKRIKKMLEIITDGVEVINKRGLSHTFLGRPDQDTSRTVIRLIDDHDNEFAAMYQQEDDDKDGAWEQGDFIINVSAKNANIHTWVHEAGHKFFYEVLTDEQAEAWKDYYKLRKYRDKDEFITKYAKENHREDFAEMFAVYVLGDDRIDFLYDKRRTNKNEEMKQKLLREFKKIVFKMAPKPPKLQKTGETVQTKGR